MTMAYCSWCYGWTNHASLRSRRVRREVYRCLSCNNQTVHCRFCRNMARDRDLSTPRQDKSLASRVADHWSNELCAEHNGTIASFERLSMQLADIADFERIFERDSWNLARARKHASFGVAGIVGVASLGGTGVPAVAATLGKMGLLGATSSGTAIASLTGPALSSASLVALGGSKAAGTAIVAAGGLTLGGALGGVIANSYHSEDNSFAIRKLDDADSKVCTLFINGFTQEKEERFDDWQRGQHALDEVSRLYGVNWSSQTLYDLGTALGVGAGTVAAKRHLLTIARSGSAQTAARINRLSWLVYLSLLARNPWHVAMFRAAQAGVQIAEAIARTSGQRFNLVGHSLGCRVIYYALGALAASPERRVHDVVLLGGAVGRDDPEGWHTALSSVTGSITNCFSDRDEVLDTLYRSANLGLSDPIGSRPIELVHGQLNNLDCTDLVSSHMTWKEHYGDILRRLQAQ